MSTNLVLFVLMLVFGYTTSQSLNDTPPQYVIVGSYNIPYFNLTIPVTLVYDSIDNRQYYDYYNGLDITMNLWNLNLSYEIGPEVYHIGCEVSIETGGKVVPVLPTDVSDWVFNGTSTYNGVQANVFLQKVVQYGVTNYYYLTVDATDGTPLQYMTLGENLIVMTSHPDLYILTIDYYSADITDYEYVFTPPSFLVCDESQESWSGEPDTNNDKQQHKIVGGNHRHHFNHAKSNEDKYRRSFDQFKDKHGREYSDDTEHNTRYNTFKDRLHKIIRHNQRRDVTYKLGMNHLGDHTLEELKGIAGGSMMKQQQEIDNYPGAGVHIPKVPLSDLPDTVDWRDSGCVAKIKDQAICGSCWAFGSMAALESQNCIVNGELVELSEQQMVSCAWQQGSQGCDGGSAYGAYQYIMENGGISTESGYPYQAVDGYCLVNQRSSGVQVQGYNRILNGSEADLQEVVATIGPVAAAIDTHLGIDDDFYFYQSGVYTSPICNSYDYDHEISVIGYGTFEGQDYWLIKNSWSTHWGMQGFAMMARNMDNSCAIATDCVYPVPIKQN